MIIIEKEKVGVVVAINRYFGRKEGQTLQDFATEIRQLTGEDRKELSILIGRELNLEVVA